MIWMKVCNVNCHESLYYDVVIMLMEWKFVLWNNVKLMKVCNVTVCDIMYDIMFCILWSKFVYYHCDQNLQCNLMYNVRYNVYCNQSLIYKPYKLDLNINQMYDI